MRFRSFNFNEGFGDVGTAAPTFDFKMTDFYPQNVENSWVFVKSYHVKVDVSIRQLEQALIKIHEKKLGSYALAAIHQKHTQFFPEESLETIAHICSDRFEKPRPRGTDDRQAHEKGIAYSAENALEARPIKVVRMRDAENNIRDKHVIVNYETPLEFLNAMCHTMAQNILRRLHDREKPLARKLVEAYLGDSMPLTISADMVLAYSRTGIAPSSEALKLQARRNPDFWQPETMEQALRKIVTGLTDPQLTTLLISGEYHRNRMWFGEETAEDVVKETISTIDTSASVKKVRQQPPSE